jgi:putative transposase
MFTVVFMCAELGVAESGVRPVEKSEALRPRRTRRRAGRGDRAPARPAQSGIPGVRRVHAGLAATGYVTSTNRVHRPRARARAPRTPPQDLARPRHPRRRRRHRRPRPRSARTSPPNALTRNGAATFPHRGAAGGAPTQRQRPGRAACSSPPSSTPRSREIIGYAMDKHHPTRLVTRALDSALASRGHPEGVVSRSDNGSQSSPRCAGEAPTSKELTEYCDEDTVVRSRGKAACCRERRRRRVPLRDPEERTGPHPPLAHKKRPHRRRHRLDRQPPQHPEETPDPQLLDTPRTHPRLQGHQRTSGLNPTPPNPIQSIILTMRLIQGRCVVTAS